MGEMRPQAQGCLESPEAGGRKDPPLEPLEGAQPWDTLTSDVLSSGWEGMDSCFLSHLVWGHLLQLPQETHTLNTVPVK